MAQLFEEGKQSFRVLLDFLVPGPLCVLIPTYVSSLIYSRYRQVAPGYTSILQPLGSEFDKLMWLDKGTSRGEGFDCCNRRTKN